MAAARRGAVTHKIAGARVLEIRDRRAEAIAGDGAGFRIAFAFDIPKLQRVEEIVERHAVEIVRLKTGLEVAEFHRTHKNFEGEAAAVAAPGAVGIRLGHDHAAIPEVLRDAVVDVVFARRPTAMILIRAVERIAGDDFQDERIERAFGVVGDELLAGVSFGERLVHGREPAFVHRIHARRVGGTAQRRIPLARRNGIGGTGHCRRRGLGGGNGRVRAAG